MNKSENIPSSEVFDAAYKRLNDAQKEAVDTIEGPVMVVAGPGTGKTQILTLRIANILHQAGAGVGPENILALTFTNAGVAAMRERLASFVGAQDAYNVGIYTFHSFAQEQMRAFPEYFGRFTYGTTIAEVQRFKALEDILAGGEFEYLKTFASHSHYIYDIGAAIDDLKNEGIDPDLFLQKIDMQEKNIIADEDSYYKRKTKLYEKGDLKPTALKAVHKNKELHKIYVAYQSYLVENNLYEFSDMVLALTSAIEDHADLHAELVERYQYVLVDEHQDTNDGQSKLLLQLSRNAVGDAPNIFTVGDDKQAIYRFQGASVENFLSFEKVFPDITKVNLRENYRSTQKVLDTAHALISGDCSDRPHVELDSVGEVEDRSLDVHAFRSYSDELAFVAGDIKQKLSEGEVSGEIALMYRKNAHIPDIVAALERENVPYKIAGRVNLLEDVEIRKLLLLMRATANPLAGDAVAEAMLIDFLPLQSLDVAKFFDVVHHQKKQRKIAYLLSDDKFLESIEEVTDKAAFVWLGNFIETQKEKGENISFLEFFEQFVSESGFLKHVLSLPTQALHLKQLDALMREIRTQIESKPGFRLADFLVYIETLITYGIRIDTATDSAEKGIELLSAHKSKGLEFTHVYITNAITGTWDHARKMQKFDLPINKIKDSLDDERRLFYVALTRAKSDVTISYASENTIGKATSSSVFLAELPKEQVTTHDHVEERVSVADQFRPRVVARPEIVDPEYFREKFLSTPLSVSALNNFIKSPLLYFFRNLIRLPQAQTKSLLFGNVIHEAMELYFKEVAKQNTVQPESVLLMFFDQALERAYLLHEYRNEMESRGRELLSRYHAQYSEDFAVTILSEEKIKAVPFILDDGTEIMLTGVIDKMEIQEDGSVRVVDYKTGKPWSKKTKDERESLQRQIVFYKLLLDSYNNSDGNKKYDMQEGVLDFVEPATKDAALEREVFQVSQAQIDTLKAEISACARAVLGGTLLEGEFVRTRDTEKYVDLWEVLKK